MDDKRDQALDAAAVADATGGAYGDADVEHRLYVDIAPGGHALATERSRSLVEAHPLLTSDVPSLATA